MSALGRAPAPPHRGDRAGELRLPSAAPITCAPAPSATPGAPRRSLLSFWHRSDEETLPPVRPCPSQLPNLNVSHRASLLVFGRIRMALAWSKAWLVSEAERGNTVLQIQQCQTLGITNAFRL